MKTNWLLLTGLGLILNFSCALAGPLDNWHWRNPLPNGNPPFGPHTLNGIVFATGKFVAVGVSGVVSISTDTTNWVESPTETTNDLNGIIYANGQFVAVGDGGVVETSTDSTNWVSRNSGTTNSLSAIAYGNAKFVAVGPSAIIASPNAVNWTPPVSPLGGATAVAGGSNGFVAVSDNAQAYFSPDGLTWTSQTLTAPGTSYNGAPLQNVIVTYWNGVYLIGSDRWVGSMTAGEFIFSSADGSNWRTNMQGYVDTGTGGFTYDFFMTTSNSVIAAGAIFNVPFLQFSTDGVNWFQTNAIPFSFTPSSLGPLAGAYGNGTYVVLDRIDYYNSLPPIYTSTDGLTWINRQHAPAPPAGPTYNFTSIATNSGVYVVASGNLVAISSNGLSYAIASNTPALSAIITLSNNFVGVGPGGAIYVSGNGLSWTQRNSGTESNLHGIAAGKGLLVAVGDAGAIQTSPSGLIWTSRESGTSLALYSVICSNGIFLAVGQEGTVLTSPDGINWTGQYSGVLSDLLSVAYGSAGFLAVGPEGTILTSPDGTNWLTENFGTAASFESVSFGNGYYLVTGTNAVVMTSPDGANWSSRNVGATGGQNFYGSAFLNSRFEIVGSNGTILESDIIAPLFDVQFCRGTQNAFTMFATPGSNFRLQACTSLSGSGWTDVAAFNNVTAITQWTNTAAGYNQCFYRLVSP
jgi:hypothetical protein